MYGIFPVTMEYTANYDVVECIKTAFNTRNDFLSVLSRMILLLALEVIMIPAIRDYLKNKKDDDNIGKNILSKMASDELERYLMYLER